MLAGHRLEVKYGFIALLLLGGLVLLSSTEALGGLNGTVEDIMDAATDVGFIGIFLIALIANSSLLIQIPYTVPLVSLALAGAGLEKMLLMGIASGIGAGFGEVISYGIAAKVLGRNPGLSESPLFQWVRRTVISHPRATPFLVFAWAASILPDDTIVIPLAMMRYGLKRIAVPLFTGKVAHGIAVALISYWFTGWAADSIATGVKTDLALGIIIAFVLVILYQVERARFEARSAVSRVREPEDG